MTETVSGADQQNNKQNSEIQDSEKWVVQLKWKIGSRGELNSWTPGHLLLYNSELCCIVLTVTVTKIFMFSLVMLRLYGDFDHEG